MRRWLVLCGAGLAGAAAAVVPALASDQTVNATPGNTWAPAEVVVAAPATSTTTTPTTPAPTFSARPARGLFCTQRSRTCTHPGITLRVRLDAPATVTGVVSRLALARNEFRRFGTLRFRLRAGRHSVRFLRTREHRLLRAGGYRVDLTALGRVVRVSFMVRPS